MIYNLIYYKIKLHNYFLNFDVSIILFIKLAFVVLNNNNET